MKQNKETFNNKILTLKGENMTKILSETKKISHSIKLDGDIIITDPGYIIKDTDWDECVNYDMKKFGLTNYIVRDTLYGDWSCTTFDSNTDQPIGEFCADDGMVGVFLLDEVLKYNPDFDYHINRPWTTTLIKNFRGNVSFQVIHREGVYDCATKFHKVGDPFSDDEVQVVGNGINIMTGEKIDFVGRQTGF